jgi:predicted NAD/FAD-dependent oxidoreductase
MEDDGRWTVQAHTGHVGDPYETHSDIAITEKFDAIVVALPAWEVLKLAGINEFFPGDIMESLSQLTYDSRYSVALNFNSWFKQDLESWFGKRSEVVLNDGVLHLVAYQGVKRKDYCVLVCHTARSFRVSRFNDRQGMENEVVERVLDGLAAQMNVSISLLRTALRACKVIDWRHCQVEDALQPPDSARQHCIVSYSAPTLMLAGDYITTSNFSGCFWSACAAARAVHKGLEQQSNVHHSQEHWSQSVVPVPRPLKSKSGLRILIVGAGATGSMLAAHLRRQFGNCLGHLAVWEAARGAAGRSATRKYGVGYDSKAIIADMGTQVLSFDNDHYPSIQEAWYLSHEGVIHRAHSLSATEERKTVQDGNCTHYWARNGTSSVSRTYLKDAQPNDLRFGCRVKNIRLADDGTVQRGDGLRYLVSANVGSVSDPHAKDSHEVVSSLQDEFHAVVLTGTAPAILRLVGCAEFSDHKHQVAGNNSNSKLFPISQELHRSLSAVQYDQRYAISMVFQPWLQTKIEAKFQGNTEILVDDGLIHMIAFQGAKREQSHPVLVVHTSRKTDFADLGCQDRKLLDNIWTQVRSRVLDMLQVDSAFFDLGLLAADIVNWRECQNVSSDSRLKSGAIAACSRPPLMLAGDFMTSASFSGVVEAVKRTKESLARCFGLEAEISCCAGRDESSWTNGHAEARMIRKKRKRPGRRLGFNESVHLSTEDPEHRHPLLEQWGNTSSEIRYESTPQKHIDYSSGGKGDIVDKYDNWESQMEERDMIRKEDMDIPSRLQSSQVGNARTEMIGSLRRRR